MTVFGNIDTFCNLGLVASHKYLVYNVISTLAKAGGEILLFRIFERFLSEFTLSLPKGSS